MTPTELLMISMEIKPLAELSAWEHVSERVHAFYAACTGQEKIDEDQVKRLRSWAAQWKRLHPSARRFYVDHLGTDTARSALWLLLEQRPISPGHKRRLIWLHTQTYGYSGVELFPR